MALALPLFVAGLTSPEATYRHMGAQGGLGMKCPKCRGLMVNERYVDYFMIRFERRCLTCGKIQNLSTLHIIATDMRPVSMARWSRL